MMMRKLIFLIVMIPSLLSCESDDPKPENKSPVSSTVLPVPDHMIFVWLENRRYSQIIGSDSAPFINSLISQGTSFTNFHSLGHPSYPQYLRFFSGSDNGKTNDDCLSGSPYTTPNLYTRLSFKGKSFAWYSEDLPSIGSTECSSQQYVERHNPSQCFANVPAIANKRWLDFPANFSLLETVVCISPNLDHDMHNGSISQGDEWLRSNCEDLINWCKTHNSVFVICFDEDQGTSDNQIPTIAIGGPIKAGYVSSVYYDHYNMTHTILEIYNAGQIGYSVYRGSINDCWK